MEEIWKDIDEFKGYYQVSNLGNVRSVERFIYTRTYPSKLIRKYEHKNQNGIFGEVVHLRVPNKVGQISRSVAKLVLTTFIGKPPRQAKQVIHKDKNPLNNKLDNLKWGVDKCFYLPVNYKARELFDKYAYKFCKMYLCKIKMYNIGIYDIDDIIQICLIKIFLVIDCFDVSDDNTEDDIKKHFYCFCRKKIRWIKDRMLKKEWNKNKPTIYSFTEYNSLVGEDYNIEKMYGQKDEYEFDKFDIQSFAHKYNLDIKTVLKTYNKIF